MAVFVAWMGTFNPAVLVMALKSKTAPAAAVFVPADSKSVPVAAGTVTVKADAAEAGVRVTLPVAVELAKVKVPFDVPATPRVGVIVQLEALVLDVFGIAPAEGALVAFVPPRAIVIVGRSPVAIALNVPT